MNNTSSTDAVVVSSTLQASFPSLINAILGVALLTFALVACGSRDSNEVPANGPVRLKNSTVVSNADIALVPYIYDGKDHSWTSDQNLRALALSNGNNDLTVQTYTSATSGWGPVELNKSNGERSADDGNTLTLNGKTYTTGLGVHAPSEITYDLNGQCKGFQSDMGIDDEVRSLGSVTFEIWADSIKLYDSGRLTGGSNIKFASVDLTGKKLLKLIVTRGGDDLNYDHGDWAGATLLGCVESKDTGSKAPSISYSGPLVIKKGGTYSGNWESQDPRLPAVSVQTSEPVIIENSNIRGRGNLISGFGNRLTVRNVSGYGLNPNVTGWTAGYFLTAEEFINIRIENVYAENTLGIYFRSYMGNSENGDTVKVVRNKFKNINGLPSNGNDGYDLDQPNKTTHMLQFNDVKRISNAEISWNEIINEPGKSQVEENINMYVSSGTPTSPILIHDNYIQGGYNAQPATRNGYAGGGIIVGDGVVSNLLDNGYTIVSTTNEGLALAGGVNSHFYNNRAVSSGLLADGRRILAQNVGMYMWDSAGTKNFSTPGFSGNTMNNNYIAWTKVAADGSTSNNPWWMPDCGVFGSTCSGNVSGGKATLDMEKQENQLWLSKLDSNNIKIGKLN